ncbi:LysR family transcriptional regulator [Levilactobacillus fuyuanensis]|uniref:LysR family transcriptional regulator n=1 Tax=Levilactobacillus fuyuanensis TaxID=2486022 RepID=A0ABW4H5J2_9LACO|nr:LysR family transcriptional regulator [Levilactobacillus fuyuanensis]
MAFSTTRLAEILTAVKNLGSITAASQHLFVSQPYISRTIKEAEQQLGIQLIDRTTKPTRLTYAGAQYLAGLQKIQQQLSDLDQTMHELAQSKSGHLSIALSESMATQVLPELVRQFLQEYPQYHLDIHEMPSLAAEKAVTDNQSDIYIGPKSAHHSAFFYRIMRDQSFSVLVPAAYPFSLPQITHPQQLASLLHQPFIGCDLQMVLGEITRHFMADHHLFLQPALTLNSLSTIQQLVESGAGWTILPTPTAIASTARAIHLDPKLLTYQLIMAHRSSKENTPEMMAFLQVAQHVFNIDPATQVKHRDD